MWRNENQMRPTHPLKDCKWSQRTIKGSIYHSHWGILDFGGGAHKILWWKTWTMSIFVWQPQQHLFDGCLNASKKNCSSLHFRTLNSCQQAPWQKSNKKCWCYLFMRYPFLVKCLLTTRDGGTHTRKNTNKRVFVLSKKRVSGDRSRGTESSTLK